jgi:nickel/cobalt transporter (NiCoT) family protein
MSGRAARIRALLTPQEWWRAAALAGAVLGLHVLGFFVLLVLVAPRGLSLGHEGAFGLGIGITAYTLGLRHAFDADHIAAIDSTTRKLMAEGRRPLSVGFFFSLGHSTVVFALAFLLAAGARGLSGQVQSDHSTLQHVTDVVGTAVSGGFLYLIGILNLAVLARIVGTFRRMRAAPGEEPELEAQLEGRGAMTRIYGRLTRTVSEPWHMYPLGILFGLGFDTATEIALLLLASGAAFSGLPLYAILCLPLLFAAGMSLLDTIDGAFMNVAYAWAFSQPVRKAYYNIAITGLTVAVALVVGTIELVATFGEQLGLTGGVWASVAHVDLNMVGYAIAALFAMTWAVAVGVWRLGRIEERWATSVQEQ